MVQGARQARRQLALDVRILIWTERLDVPRFIRTGMVQPWIVGAELPDTPLMRQAKTDLERERAEHERRSHA